MSLNGIHDKWSMISRRPPKGMAKVESRKLIQLGGPYQLIVDQLYVFIKDDIIARFTLPRELDDMFLQAHDKVARRHYTLKLTIEKVIQAGLF